MRDSPPSGAAAEPRCSFCSSPRARVRALIAGPGRFIFDACVQMMLEETAEATPPGAVCSLSLQPQP